MINVCRYVYTGARANLYGWLIVDHLFTLSGNNIDNFFGTGVVMSCVPFFLGQFNDTETEAVCIGNRRFAEEVNFSPVKFHAINVLRAGDNARSKSLHSGGIFLYLGTKNSMRQALCAITPNKM